jgi:hypothetical protein
MTSWKMNAQSLDETSLSSTILQLEKTYQVSFSYASALLEDISAPINLGDSSLHQAIETISKFTNFNFEEVQDGYYLISPRPLEVCVKIIDRETSEPLPGVLVSHRGKYLQTSSNSQGVINYNSHLTIKDSIDLQFIGYGNQTVSVGELYRNPCKVIALNFATTTLNELVITNYLSTGINASKKDHSLEINTEDLALLPGETDGDILLAIKTLPGITSPNGKAGNLHFRGSTTDQTLLMYDNIPIYHKGHYYGAISPYNPNMVDKVKVYRNGYAAQLGGRVGGAIDMNSSQKIPDSTLVGIGLNSFYGAGFIKSPITKNLAISAAIRTSYPSSWNSPKLDALNEMVYTPSVQSSAMQDANVTILEDEFKFRDVNATSVYNMSNGQLKLSYLNIENHNIFSFQTPMGGRNEIDYKLTNEGATLSWLEYWNPKISSDFSLTYAHYNYFSSIVTIPLNQPPRINNEFNNEITDIKIKSIVNLIEEDRTISLGYEGNHIDTEDNNILSRMGVPDTVDINQSSFLHSVFLNYENRLFDKLVLNAGLRASHYTLTKDSRVEPRFTASYQLSSVTLLKANVGMYSQFISQNVFFDFEDTRAENLTWFLVDEGRPLVKSSQIMLGSAFVFSGLVIDFESYYKQVDNLTTQSGMMTPQFISGELNVIGADLLIRKRFGELDTWIAYSYLDSDMEFLDINQQEFPTYYDQPHTLNVTGTLSANNWQFSMGWFISSGAPNYLYSTFFPEPGMNPQDPNIPISQDLNDGRFPATHQLDAAIVYNIPARDNGWKASIGLSVLNVYDQENLVEEGFFTFGPNTVQSKRYNIGFAPNLMIQIEW